MNIDLIKILNNFDSISLNQLGNAKLMDRTDTKFIFHYNELPSILNDLKLHYKCLEIEGVINSTYETLYFDTINNLQYIQHHNGKANRYKIRFRNYIESKIGYLEIKLKSNKDRTIKTRIKSKLEDSLTETQKIFIESNSNLNPELLIPKVWINYKRICLVSKTSNERLTLDTNLEIINGSKNILLDKLVIAEVKREEASGLEVLASSQSGQQSQERHREGVVAWADCSAGGCEHCADGRAERVVPGRHAVPADG